MGGTKTWLLGGAAALAWAGPGAAEGYVAHRDHVLGTSLDIVANAGAESAASASAAALDEVLRLDAVLSGWRADSELAALNASSRFAASSDLFEIIAFGEEMRARTGGVFSPRLGLITQAWRDAAVGGVRPEQAALLQLGDAAARADVQLDRRTRTITRPPSVRFDVDGFAKGYIIDRAMTAARRAAPGLKGLTINLGGDVAVWGEPATGGAWTLGVAGRRHDNAAPDAVVRLSNASLAVSGPGARDFRFSDGAVSHLLSPRTGAPSRARAAVVAATAMQADALATALAIMPADEAVRLADSFPGVAARIAAPDGRIWRSSRWAEAPAPVASCQAAPAPAAPWPAGFELDVSFEIPRIDAANYEKPYIAIWITDENRQLVRTLLVLGDRARWRESNYIWWRRFERLNPDAVQALARPTRAPGRYDVVWDGRDNEGKLVGQGRYTLTIEASREHGQHSIQTIPLDLAGAPVEAAGAAQPEIGAVTARYGRGS